MDILAGVASYVSQFVVSIVDFVKADTIKEIFNMLYLSLNWIPDDFVNFFKFAFALTAIFFIYKIIRG